MKYVRLPRKRRQVNRRMRQPVKHKRAPSIIKALVTLWFLSAGIGVSIAILILLLT